MPTKLRLGIAQSHTQATTAQTLAALAAIAQRAAAQHLDLVLFPEAYLGGYPRTATFGAAVGSRSADGREQFRRYFADAVDLGDTPDGAGRRWVDKQLELPPGGVRGDGTREELERVARDSGVFLVVGLIERSGGTLYCAVVYVCPRLGVIGKRRKVMPTGTERLVWGQGQPSSLRAVTTTIRGVKLTMAAAICWENYMPLLRQSLYSQNVNLYLAPTADARDTWLSLMRTIAGEGRCVVLSANQCVTRQNLPAWITAKDEAASPNGELRREDVAEVNGPLGAPLRRRQSVATADGHEIALPGVRGGDVLGQDKALVNHRRRRSTVTEDGSDVALPPILDETASTNPQESAAAKDSLVCRGGSCIVSPMGDVLCGPIWDMEDVLEAVEIDFDDCIRGRLDIDVAGSYSRNDAFKLTVEGLDLSPPP